MWSSTALETSAGLVPGRGTPMIGVSISLTRCLHAYSRSVINGPRRPGLGPRARLLKVGRRSESDRRPASIQRSAGEGSKLEGAALEHWHCLACPKPPQSPCPAAPEAEFLNPRERKDAARSRYGTGQPAGWGVGSVGYDVGRHAWRVPPPGTRSRVARSRGAGELTVPGPFANN